MKGTASVIGLGIALLFVSCKKELPQSNENITTEKKDIHDLIIPEDFDYASTKSLKLEFDESSSGKVVYEIYTAYENFDRELIAKGQPINGVFSQQIIVPKFCSKIQVVRNVNGNTQSYLLNVTGTSLKHGFSNINNRESCSEVFYAVNTAKELYQIENKSPNYDTNALPDLITGGVMTCAIDPSKGRMYYNSGNSLYYYDIEKKISIELFNSTPFPGQYKRMAFNTANNLLYIAKKDELFIINPEDNTTKASITLKGLDNPNVEGDIAINSKGDIFMTTFSGLYKLDPIKDLSSSVIGVTKISSKKFKYKLTSAVFDKDDRLYVATHDSKSKLMEMDPQTGDYSILKTLPFRVNDLCISKCTKSNINLSDKDNDGVIDEMDDYPENREAAFDIYTPSETNWGSLAFEDLWPYEGDYDFNDLVVNYRINQIANANNKVYQLHCSFQVKAVVNSYKNGFAIELPIDQSLVKKVTGSSITDNLVVLNEKGLEPGHSNAVFVVFDNAFKQVNNWGACVNYSANPIINVVVEFNEPIDASKLGEAPYNPFIFVDGDRSKEIHLSSGAPTSKANKDLMGSKDDDSDPDRKRYYKTKKNLPWAIHMAYEFVYPKEKVKVNKGYHKFNNWAESNGSQYPDWYMNNVDYRNDDMLCK